MSNPINPEELPGLVERADHSNDHFSEDEYLEAYRKLQLLAPSLAAEVMRLREALEHIANYYGPNHRVTELARKALGGSEG